MNHVVQYYKQLFGGSETRNIQLT